MRRYQYPYNGKQFLLNKNTGEIHDLDREDSECKINLIKSHHISMHDTFLSATVYAKMNSLDFDGCAHCMPEKHTH